MFQGYTDETFEFFMAIRFNNNRAFFHENYDWYQRAVRTPSIELAQALGDIVEDIDPELERRPYRCLSHINRDIRFSTDKSPYRDYLWISFKRPGADDGRKLALYFELNDDCGSYGMGFYRENPEMMGALRKRMELNPQEVLDVLNGIGDFDLTLVNGRRVKAPNSVPPGLKPWYAAKGFYFSKDIRDFDLIKSPRLFDEIRDGFFRLKPMFAYLSRLSGTE